MKKITKKLKILSKKDKLLCLLGVSFCIVTLNAVANTTHMLALDGAANDQLGSSSSVSGNTGIAGAPNHQVGTNASQGAVYLYRNLHLLNGTITQDAKLLASDGAANDLLGSSVSISGNIGLVGSPYHDASFSDRGAAYVYRNLNTATGSVTQDVKLLSSDGAANDLFGSAAGLSGNIGVVGAPFHDVGFSDQGAAYVFRNLNTATGTVTQNVKLLASDAAAGDRFGSAVSIDGTIAAIGAPYHDDSFTDEGAVYVFRNMDTAIGTITQNAKLIAPTPGTGALFGHSVAVWGTQAIVGAPGWYGGTGRIFIYDDLDTVTGTISTSSFQTDGHAAGDNLGYSVGISSSGWIAGAPKGDIGSNLDQGYVRLSYEIIIWASAGQAGDEFGYSVWADGDRFFVGSRNSDVIPNTNQGKTYSNYFRTFNYMDVGNETLSTNGLSAEAGEIAVGMFTSNNTLIINTGDYLGQNDGSLIIGLHPGSNNNLLIIEPGATLKTDFEPCFVGNFLPTNTGNELRVNGTLLALSQWYVSQNNNILSGYGVIHAGSELSVSGSVRPGDGGIGTLTVLEDIDPNNHTAFWYGYNNSPWIFELGIAMATLNSANTGGTRDLLDITGDFIGDTSVGDGIITFDFAGTGSLGWYKLVDWTGITNFTVNEFVATNYNPLITSYQFVIDPATTALYINFIPEPGSIWAVFGLLGIVLVVIRLRRKKAAKTR